MNVGAACLMPRRLTVKGIWRQVFRRGEGTPPYARIFKWGCRAASPLAAVAACGGGKVPGRDIALGFGGVRAPRPTHGFSSGCRAASPLAAVAVCGSGKVSGRDESLPYKQTERFAAMNVVAPLDKSG